MWRGNRGTAPARIHANGPVCFVDPKSEDTEGPESSIARGLRNAAESNAT